MHWFHDPEIVRRLPLRYRAYAGYSRRMFDARSGRVPGGSALFAGLAAAARAFRLGRDAEVRVSGTAVAVDLTDSRIFWVFEEVRGEHAEAGILRDLLRRGDTFLDLGANHGAYSLLAAPLVGERGRVIAFEPNPRLATLLRRSAVANGYDWVEVVESAAAERAGSRTLYVPRRNSGGASLFPGFAARSRHGTVEVAVASLDALLAGRETAGRVFLKMDVEGSELAVLTGAAETLRRHRPVLLVESNPTTMAAAELAPSALPAALEEVGYRRFSPVSTYPERIASTDVDWRIQQNLVAWPDGGPWDRVA